jgi:hypothetical protein
VIELTNVKFSTYIIKENYPLRRASAPAQTNDKIGANSVFPVHGICSGTLVVGKVTKVAVVVLNVVDTSTSWQQARFGSRSSEYRGQETC